MLSEKMTPVRYSLGFAFFSLWCFPTTPWFGVFLFLVFWCVIFFFGGFLPTIFLTINYNTNKTQPIKTNNTTIKKARGWFFSCLVVCGFLVVVFLCLFNRANLHTHPTPNTNLLIDVRILKSFFILHHFNS